MFFFCLFGINIYRIWRLTKLDQPKSAIVFSYDDRQAHLQLFTSRLSVFSEHGILGSSRNLHRNTLSCLCTMQQYFFCGGAAELAGPRCRSPFIYRALKARLSIVLYTTGAKTCAVMVIHSTQSYTAHP